MKGISTKIILIMLVTALIAPMTALAQIDSLAVWENIADGTLTSTWVEFLDAEWKGENKSGVWIYNSTTDNQAWTVNDTVEGDRWYQTFEVQISNSDGGIGSIQTRDGLDFYGVLYYLDSTNHPMGDGTPEAFIVYNDGGTMYYWNSSGYETNISNATDLSGDCEADLLSDFCRVKALWNWNTDDGSNNCTVRFKIWNPSGDEPPIWMVDEAFPYYPGAENTSWKSGLFSDASFGATLEADFTRIFFWNLSYDLYQPILPTVNTEIVCPTYNIYDMYDMYMDSMDPDDIWNETQLFKNYINLWDLNAIYTEDFWGASGNQNDSTYVFTMMLTDTREFYEDMFGPGIPDDFPDNILEMQVYNTPDASSNESDYMLLRIDTDNNNVYDSYDYAIWSNDTELVTYQGWTPFESIFFCDMYGGPVWADEFGEVFRDETYFMWYVDINWDMIYNGSSGERVGTDLCRMSIGWYDNDTDAMLLLQDFDETDDTTPYPPTDGRNVSRDPVWEEYNDSQNWLYFYIDESISGEPLADPEDEVSMYDDLDETTVNLLTTVLPLLIVVAVIVLIFGLITTMGATKESLITIMIVTIFAIILIQIILGL
jgi:hypothetical protein